jgi:hypothetical protein
MTQRTRTQITIHTQERIVVRRLNYSPLAHCEKCGEPVLLVTLENAAAILQGTLQQTRSLLAAGGLHTAEAETGAQLICCNSISTASMVEIIQIEGETL